MNEKYDLPKKKKVMKTSVYNDFNTNRLGISPVKKGPKQNIPLYFWNLLDCHISMTQLEGKEETKPRKLKALIGAALKNIEFASTSKDYVYKEFRRKFPHTVCPMKAMEMEECHAL